MNTKVCATSIIVVVLSVTPVLASAEEVGLETRGSVRTELVKERTDARASTTLRVKGTASSTKPARADDRIVRAKEHADREVDRRVDNLTRLVSRIDGMVRISVEERTSLRASLQAQIDALTALKAKIDAEDDTATLRTDIKSITTSHRTYALIMPQAAAVAADDRVLAIASQMELLSGKLSARISTAASTGADVSVLTSTLADYDAKVADAKVQAESAVVAVAALSPDNGDQTVFEANIAALKAARAKVQAAQQDLVAARKDAEAIAKGLRSIRTSAHTSAEATTTTP